MDIYPWTMRVLHVAAGIFWTGGTWFLAGFLTPAAKETGQSGQEIMRNLIQKRQLSTWLGVASLITLLTGLLLYWRSSSGLNPSWILSGRGLSLTIGGLAGLATFVMGFAVNRPAATRIGEIGAQLAAADGPPAPETLEEMQALQAKLESAGIWGSILLAIAVLGMAGAQQLYF